MNANKWFADDGDNTHRLNYPLTSKSVVFDVGGYKGWFTEQINDRYSSSIYCFEPLPSLSSALKDKFKDYRNITVIPAALSDKNGTEEMVMDKDSSRITPNGGVAVRCMTLDSAMEVLGVDHIDLLKINIEGGEYPLLADMSKKDLITSCTDIQVQFHDFVTGHQELYADIRSELEKTHELTYRYPFVWENWRLK